PLKRRIGCYRLQNEQGPAKPQCLPSLVKRAALLRGLDNDRCVRQQGHCAIAHREILWLNWHARAELRNHKVVFRDPFKQRTVAGWVGHVDRRTEDGQRMAPRLKRSRVRLSINALGETADHNGAPFSESARKLPSAT